MIIYNQKEKRVKAQKKEREENKMTLKEEIIAIIKENFTIEELNSLAGESLDFWSKDEEGTEISCIAWDEN